MHNITALTFPLICVTGLLVTRLNGFKTFLDKTDNDSVLPQSPTKLSSQADVLPPEKKLQVLPVQEESKWVEQEAMDLVKKFELKQRRTPEDLSAYYVGYDIRSNTFNSWIAIEVKGKAQAGNIMITKNEWKTAQELGDKYHIYIVEGLRRGTPTLKIIRNPASKIKPSLAEAQYILPKAVYHGFRVL